MFDLFSRNYDSKYPNENSHEIWGIPRILPAESKSKMGKLNIMLVNEPYL